LDYKISIIYVLYLKGRSIISKFVLLANIRAVELDGSEFSLLFSLIYNSTASDE
jgi:hypothetical protein